MAPRFEPNLAATGVGSLPHREARAAVDFVLDTLPEAPFWPQLPALGTGEGMYHQGADGVPGVQAEGGRLWIERGAASLSQLQSLSPESEVSQIGSAAGLEEMLGRDLSAAALVKGQLVGPVSLGLSLVDQERRPILYSEEYAAALAQILSWRLAWMESRLKAAGKPTLVLVDEPYLTTLGSGFFAYDEVLVRDLLSLSLSPLTGLRGVHCCGKVDWPVLLDLGVDVLSFDAHQYFASLALFPESIGRFLEGGGILAWGIVPTDPAEIQAFTALQLTQRLEGFIQALEKKGLSKERLLVQAMVTPACGLASADVARAERAVGLAARISALMRERHGLDRAAIAQEE